MCGISGIYGLPDQGAAERKITAMNGCMHHRGPDDDGVFTGGKIALGHRRLSIIDLSAAGHQPMHSYDNRYTIVYNGELYNYRELKFELQRVISGSGQQAYFFQTNTDTEVIIAAYARWGEDCVKHFNGMFAFAIWDSHTGELFIARDRLGIKPLYYLYTNAVFAFASELRALLASGLIDKKVDADSLVDYLRYQTVHAPHTIIKGVKMLLPGHSIRIRNGKPVIKEYWSLAAVSSGQEVKSYQETCAEVNRLLTQSVERRLIADVPFGAFLSGGIDSSIIVGLMSRVSAEKVKTFSVTFDESEFSEAKYAQQVAKKFNTEHHELLLSPADFIEELPAGLKAMDHPSGDGLNTYVVSKATKAAGITMALSGLGGDELFAGYDVFKRAAAVNKRRWLNHVPAGIRKIGGGILAKAKPSVGTEKIAALLAGDKIGFGSFYALSRQVLTDKQAQRILGRTTLSPNAVEKIISGFPAFGSSSVITQVSAAEIATYMQNVLLRDADQMSMAHALEVRVPFLDHTLVDYVLALPDKYKSTASPKKLLVDAMGDLLPQEIVNRPKMGFTFPWKHWMKNELRGFCEQRIQSLAKRSMFNEQEVIKLWNSFQRDDPRVSWSRLWILIVFENWMLENGISD